jgi:hypothetical protein
MVRAADQVSNQRIKCEGSRNVLQSRHEDSIKLGKGQQDQIQRKQIKVTIDIKEAKEKRRANKHILKHQKTRTGRRIKIPRNIP